MGNGSNFLKIVRSAAVAAVLLSFGMMSKTVNADSFTGSTLCSGGNGACWAGISVSGVDNGTSPVTSLTSTDTVEFWASGSTESVALTCTSNCTGLGSGGNTASLFGSFIISSASAPSVSSTTPVTFSSVSDSVCVAGRCNTGSAPNDTIQLISLGSGQFGIVSNSNTLTFTLPEGTVSTPEPGSLLMLGSGLLGLLGYGFRRKAV
jgi:hypothetical protein